MSAGLQQQEEEWPGYDKFSAVQSLLDRNQLLIEEINTNHGQRSQEALGRNVALINELNDNCMKIVALYKELSDVFVSPEEAAAAAAAAGQGGAAAAQAGMAAAGHGAPAR
jgi:hypothetical protein